MSYIPRANRHGTSIYHPQDQLAQTDMFLFLEIEQFSSVLQGDFAG
jgi:hypothetical protein